MDKLTTVGNSFIDARLDFNNQIQLPNGIRLILETQLTKYAERKKLKNARVFLSIDTKNYMEYILVIGEQVEYANTSVEDIGCHIDMMSVAENMT